MQIINILGVVFLIEFATKASTSGNNKDDVVVKSSDPLTNEHVLYTSEHDVISLTIAFNLRKFANDTDDSDIGIEFYFVEADVNNKGLKEYKGIYSFKKGKATKILETGTDVTVTDDGTEKVYISAKDGIYCFDAKTNKIEKYGTVSESLIGIAKTKSSDTLYILTEGHDVYKVTEDGNKKEKLQDVKDAQQIVLDYSNNLYFYNKDKIPFVVTQEGVQKIVGIPENLRDVQLVKSPRQVRGDEIGAIFMANDIYYFIYVNGTSKATDLTFLLKPTAYALNNPIIQYYSYKKKIYERNFISRFFDGLDKRYETRYLVIQCSAKNSRNESTTYIESRVF